MPSLLEQVWYRKSYHLMTLLLLPASWLFGLLIRIRFFCYRIGLLKSYRARVPVVVVGNITVGGTGKTPFVIWLANFLRDQGLNPGIVSRGVGGQVHAKAHRVHEKDAPKTVGDEAILLAQETQCPVVLCVDRAKAVRSLLANTEW